MKNAVKSGKKRLFLAFRRQIGEQLPACEPRRSAATVLASGFNDNRDSSFLANFRHNQPLKARFLKAGAAFTATLLIGLLGYVDIALSQSDIATVAAREAQKRQSQVKAAQTLYTAGASAMSDRSYGEAMDNFKGAFRAMPNVPAVEDQRRIFFKQFQTASLAFTDVLIEEAKWAEAVQTLEGVLETAQDGFIPDSLIDPNVKITLEELRVHDGRFNQAMTPQHLRNIEEVQAKLILAKGYMELGDYDRADYTYNRVLNIDPSNEAARRGQEEVERYRTIYYDAAYNQTRAKALAEVAAGWETPIVRMDLGDGINTGATTEIANSGNVIIEQKLKNIIIPSLEFRDARLVDVIDFLVAKSQELDVNEADPARKGVSIVVDPSGSIDGQDLSQLPVTVRLTSVPMEAALKYVTQLVGMKYRIDEYAVFVVPNSVAFDEGMITRRYPVPPGFISSGNQGVGSADAINDPFATPSASGSSGLTLKRITAEEFLEQSGVVFPPGASANYIPTTSTLVVTNNVDQHATVENLIQISKDSGSKMVKVNVKMVSIENENLEASGLDWLLGAANLGSSSGTFFSGGTDGSTSTPTSVVDFPLLDPVTQLPIGLNPVTSGLRMADVSSTQTIEDVINRNSPSSPSAKYPGVFSVAGAFTDPQFQMVLRALSQSKGSDVMCDVHVFVKPGQIASIEQVREFIYPTEYDPPEIPNQIGGGIGDGAVEVFPVTPATPTAFETRSLGKIIEVEPTVSSDNLAVNLNVTADFSDFIGFINYGTPILGGGATTNGQRVVVTENEILMPVFDVVRETTNVTVWDGQTIAIGGFHGESVEVFNDKVPVVGDLPVLGRAFRSNGSDRNKRALLIFVSVRLVDPGGNPINAAAEVEPELMTRLDDSSN